MFCFTSSAAAAHAPVSQAARARNGPLDVDTVVTAAQTPPATNGAATSSPLGTVVPEQRGDRQRSGEPARPRGRQSDPATLRAAMPTHTTVTATATAPMRRHAITPPRASATLNSSSSNGGRSTKYGPYREPPPACQCFATCRKPDSSADNGAPSTARRSTTVTSATMVSASPKRGSPGSRWDLVPGSRTTPDARETRDDVALESTVTYRLCRAPMNRG